MILRKMVKQITLLLFCFSMISGCAIYDTKRGILVSSRVQTIAMDTSGFPSELSLLPFKYNSEGIAATQSQTYSVAGGFFPVSFTYVFDNVDRQYLFQSVKSSLEKSGVKVVASSQNKLSLEFQQLGMVQDGGYSVLVLSAKASLDDISKNLSVKGPKNSTVASSKNAAIRLFLKQLAGAYKR